MTPCLSAVTTLSSSFVEDLNAYAEAGITAFEVWLTKLEQHLGGTKPANLAATRQALAKRGLTAVGAAYQGGLLLSQGEEWREQFNLFQSRLALCQELGIQTLVLVPDYADQVDAAGLSRAQRALLQIAELAGSFGVRIALEFRSNTRWCASVPTALALVQACGSPQLGLCLDLFHYYTGPSKFEDLAALTAQNLFAVHVCDLAGVPREFAGDGDRIFPGEGDFHYEPLVAWLRRIGYAGYVSVEVMNPELWRMKPVQVAEAAITAVRRLLGVAAMGPGLTRGQTVRLDPLT